MAASRSDTTSSRGAWLRQIREFLHARGFVEVNTPVFFDAPTFNPHIREFRTQFRGRTLYLQTSPEHYMKRLLADGGVERMYQIAPFFRDDELGDHHSPEFLGLELYEVGATHHDLMDLTEALVRELGSFPEPFERLRVADAFARHADVQLVQDRDGLAARARAIGVNVAESDAFDDIFFRIFLEHVEPKLTRAFLYDYPASMAVMARVVDGWAQRVELFIDGVELANGFHEETDAAEQRRRFVADRAASGRDDEPLDEAFLAALESMPEAAGIAIGLDRLFMVLSGAKTLADVLLFPFVV